MTERMHLLTCAGISITMALLLGLFVGPLTWYLVHGSEPILSLDIMRPATLIAPAIVGMIVGGICGNAKRTGIILVLSIVVVYLIFGFNRVRFFADPAIGWQLITALNIAFSSVISLVGVFIGARFKYR